MLPSFADYGENWSRKAINWLPFILNRLALNLEIFTNNLHQTESFPKDLTYYAGIINA